MLINMNYIFVNNILNIFVAEIVADNVISQCELVSHNH